MATDKTGSRRRKRFFRYPLTVGLLLVFLLGGGKGWVQQLQHTRSIQNSTVPSGEMQVTFLNVGQGDCTLIQTENQAMLVDTGNNDQGELVVQALEERGVTKLAYLILTHPDADHIGGADNVLRAVTVEKVLMPDLEADTYTYREVAQLLEQQSVAVEHPSVGASYSMDDATFTVVCPQADLVTQENTNNASVGVKLVHGENAFLLCGDAEWESETAMVKTFGKNLACDVLKCSHHGSSTGTTDSFLKAADPTYAVISCGAGNDYGHPHTEVLSRLEENDVQIYRTDLLGNILATSDGKILRWSVENP